MTTPPRPVPYQDDIETPVEDEAKMIAAIAARMEATNLDAFRRHRHAIRDAHAKSHGVLTGTLTVRDGLAPELAQGLFARPATYEVVARLSSAPGDIHSDEIPQPRGFAIKVMGVEGARLLDGDDRHSQDFLLVNLPVLPFGDIPKYAKMLDLLEKRAHAPETLQKIGAAAARGLQSGLEALGRDAGPTLQGLALGNDNPLGETYFSQGALRMGAYYGKVSLAPASENLRALSGQPVADMSYARLEEVIRDAFAQSGGRYELRVQLCTDPDTMPVEDAAVEWDSKAAPHVTVATLDFPAQNSFSDARRVYADDVLAFSPWNGIAAHRPLGSIMRIRRAVYQASADRRHRLNAVAPAEPRELADIPA